MKPLLVLLIQFSLTKLFALMRWVLHGFRSRGPLVTLVESIPCLIWAECHENQASWVLGDLYNII